MATFDKRYPTVYFGKNRVITAHSDVFARVELGAPLANNDATRCDQLALVSLDAKHLGLGIAAVTGATTTFFVCEQL
ncbi:hypothetical protein TPY_0655 [Sulfobacillus acidophilus TPY]|nr:hypothetical protein TPY_0655 [Sulfobacillus acidophilus TPY]